MTLGWLFSSQVVKAIRLSLVFLSLLLSLALPFRSLPLLLLLLRLRLLPPLRVASRASFATRSARRPASSLRPNSSESESEQSANELSASEPWQP